MEFWAHAGAAPQGRAGLRIPGTIFDPAPPDPRRSRRPCVCGRRLLAACGGLALLAAPLPGLAQGLAPNAVTPPSQITPPNLRPPQEPPAGLPSPAPPPPLRAPKGAAGLDVIIDDVVVTGGFAELAAETASLVGPIKGRRVTVAEIYRLANSLEQDYAREGFALARVTVPPQQLLDHGTLHLLVIDGFIEEIDVRGVPPRVRDAVAERLAWLRERRHVTLGEIERAVLIASDLPGVTLRSTLAPGTSEGGTRLIIDAAQPLLTGSLGVNDRLPASLGQWQYSGSLAVNSPFGFGEQFYGTFGLGADLSRAFGGTTPFKLYGGGVVVPLGYDGLTINPEYTHTRTLTLPKPGLIPSSGEFDRYAVRLSDPVIRRRRDTLIAQVSLEHITQKSSVPSLDTDLSLDRYTVVRLGADYSTTLFQSTALELSLMLSRGLGGRGAAQGLAAGLPLSILGGTPDFNKVNATIHITQALPGALSLEVTGQGQSSFGKPMLQSEQFSLTGANSVSAFADGLINVDEGGTLRLELERSFPVPVRATAARLAPYLFAAGGYGHLTRPTQVQQAVTTAEAFGIGARGSFTLAETPPGVNFGIELARQLTDQAGLRQGWRCSLNFSVTF